MGIEEDKIKEIKEATDEDAVGILNAYVEEQTDLAYERGRQAALGEDDVE